MWSVIGNEMLSVPELMKKISDTAERVFRAQLKMKFPTRNG